MPSCKASALKLYLHYQAQPPHTHILSDVTAEVTIGDVCKLFAKALIAKGVGVDPEQLQASTAKGRILAKSSTVHKAFSSDADAYITLVPGNATQKVTEDTPRLKPDAAASSNADVDDQHAPDGKLPALVEKLPGAQQTRVSPLIAPLLSQAAEKEAAQHLRSAAFIYQQACPPRSFQVATFLVWLSSVTLPCETGAGHRCRAQAVPAALHGAAPASGAARQGAPAGAAGRGGPPGRPGRRQAARRRAQAPTCPIEALPCMLSPNKEGGKCHVLQ